MPLPVNRIMEEIDMESCLDLIEKSLVSAQTIVILADGAVKATTLAKAQSLLTDLEAERRNLRVRLGWV